MKTLVVIWVTAFITTFGILVYIDRVINENLAQATGNTTEATLKIVEAGGEQTFYYPTVNPQMTITVKQLQGGK